MTESDADEAFWREQERRHQNLEQPCCTQSNMSWSLVDMAGDLAIVIHGESDCLNCFFHHQGRSTARYYSSRLTELQITTGETAAPLRHLLELLVEHRRPEAVLVLGTCPVEVIGDAFEQVVAEVARRSGVPMVALRTHGLALMSQARCQDWLHAELAALGPPGQGTGRGINLVGLPRAQGYPEVEQLLGELGLTVNGVYPNGTSLAQWRAIGRAAQSFVVDRAMFPQLLGRLEGWGQQIVETPMPVGIEATVRFFGIIAEHCGVADKLETRLRPLVDRHQAALDRTAALVRGRRVALCIRMLKTHHTDRLAYDGLADLPLLRSLGFEVAIMVQGPPESGARDRFAERLELLGHGDVPFDVFQGPWQLGDQLREGGFDMAVISDVARNVVEQAGVQMIPGGIFRPLFAGMPANLRLFERVAQGWS